ncbi:hypothetical protein QBC99_003412 [Beijerinckia sp. GAS462]|nr:hypothetical protein [Beijerinckia sp. GAS462]SEC82046.1 hypothetical protein SAMN05443249_3643 [Beijerinckia sp. 28-YEA-48]
MKLDWSPIWLGVVCLSAFSVIGISGASSQQNQPGRYGETPYEEFETRVVRSYLSIVSQEDKAWSGEPIEMFRPGRTPTREDIERYTNGAYSARFRGLGECLRAVMSFIGASIPVSQIDKDRSLRRYDHQALYRRFEDDYVRSGLGKEADVQEAMNRIPKEYVKRADACDVWRTGKAQNSEFRGKYR